jgi:hypothetical protein
VFEWVEFRMNKELGFVQGLGFRVCNYGDLGDFGKEISGAKGSGEWYWEGTDNLNCITQCLTVVGLVLLTGLGGQGEGKLFTAWFSNHDLLLLNGVGGVLELGNVEALVLNNILTLDFGDLNGLGNTDFVGVGVGKGAGLFLGLPCLPQPQQSLCYQGH